MRALRWSVPARVFAASCGAIALLGISIAAPAQDRKPEDRVWFNRTAKWFQLEDGDERNLEELRHVITANLERSYLTFGSGFRFSGDDSRSNLVFEGQLFENFSWFVLDKKKIWVDVPIRIGVRMVDSRSRPVRTPSFNPGLRILGDWNSEPHQRLQYWSVGIHHYSNGQDGEAVDATGNPNLDDGSFSTNYLELAVHRAWQGKGIEWARLGWRYHFSRSERGLRNQYEKAHLALSARTRDLQVFGVPTFVTYTGTYSYSGREYVIWNEVDPSRNVKAKGTDNLHTTLELMMIPNSFLWWDSPWRDICLFARYDYGYDYYNIHFQTKINRLQVGIASTNF